MNNTNTSLIESKLKYLILGFDGETEQYLLDDLNWFSDYFEKHVQLTIAE